MGEALFDLEQVLRSKKEKLTLQEANILMEWRARAMRDFTVGICGGSIVAWLATRRIPNLFRVLNFPVAKPRVHNLFRLNLTLGAAGACGLWQFRRSIKSSVEHILSLQGSRIQRELASIMMRRYNQDPWVLQLLSKTLYSEQVYDDSSVDRPMIRWHFRNFYEDPSTRSQSTSYGNENDSKENDAKKTTVEPKHVRANAAGDAMENPFDLIFGLHGSEEDVPQPDTPTRASSRSQTRKEKRARRRRNRHHHKESDI